MTYNFIFEDDFSRIISAVLIDARASIPEIANQVGTVIKAYTDSKVAQVNDNTITYKIETDLGVLAGYFTIQVNTSNKTAVLDQFVLRPAFQGFTEIQSQIVNFIQSGDWKPDFLF